MNYITKLTPEIRELESFHPPKPSIATRKIPKRSKISGKGALVAHFDGNPIGRILRFESLHEKNVLLILLSQSSVKYIWEQPPFFLFTDPTGKTKKHTPDALVTYRDGRKDAIVVKAHEIASRPDFQSELKAIRAALRKDYADRLILMTEAHFTRAEALNSARLHAFRRLVTPEINRRVDDALSVTDFPTSISALVEDLGLGGVGFQALFPALYDGRLITDLTKEITSETIVAKGDIL